MRKDDSPNYWASVLIQLRNNTHRTQAELAKELGVSRETIIRWEAGKNAPSIKQINKIGELANSCNVLSIYGITQVVNNSPFPMLLTNQRDDVLAASKSSGFCVGKTVFDQTPADERDNYIMFSKMVADTGFWEKADNTFEYKFEVGNQKRSAVIQSVGSRGHIFALVQKL